MDKQIPDSPPKTRSPSVPCTLPRRLAAMIYDGLLLLGLWMIATAIVIVPIGHGIEPGTLTFRLYLLVVAWAYFVISWRRGGQTLGMKAWRIRLRTESPPISWGRATLRFVVALLSLGCLGLGFAWSLFHPQRATWHDLASDTRVVVEPGPGASISD